MDFGAREILILLGFLVIVAILLHGIRSVSRARHGKLRTSPRRTSRNTAIFDDDDDYPGELPGRGSRVVKVRDERSAEEVSEKIKRDCDYTRNKFTSPFKARKEKPSPDHDPDIFDDAVDEAVDSDVETPSATPAAPVAPSMETFDHEPVPSEKGFAQPAVPFTVNADDDDLLERSREPVAPSRSAPEMERGRSQRQAPAGQSSLQPPPQPHSQGGQDDILVLHLMAQKGKVFEGEKLLEQFLDHGLRYGAMRIFHRHETPDGAGPVHFSVASAVNPGVFDLNLMDQFTTPGITFIMPLEGLEKPLESFDTLINTAVSLCRKLDGELKDDTRSAFTKQTIEHYRQRIIDFTRRSFTLTN